VALKKMLTFLKRFDKQFDYSFIAGFPDMESIM